MDNIEFRSRARRLVSLLLTILYISQMIFLIRINRGDQLMIFNGKVSVSGVISAFQFLIAVVVTMVDYKIGGRVAQILVTLGTVLPLIQAIRSGNYSPLPGVFYSFAGLVAITLIRDEIGNINRLSRTDFLTGISNRRNILDYLNNYIKERRQFYLLYLDLDHFKYVNDTKGHERGDEVLKTIVDLWKLVEPKHAILGRIGGDEFLVIIDRKYCSDVENLAYEYSKVIKQWIDPESNSSLYVTVSIGIAAYPENADSADELIRKADIAMYSAKNSGRNMWTKYDVSLEKEVKREEYILMKIREALINGKLRMVYQPQYSLSDKKIRGFEALIRLDLPDGTTLPPSEFIPVAEKSESIIAIGEFVLSCATKNFANIVKENPDCLISVNISPKQILTGDFYGAVKRILDENEFPANNLEIEITEYCLMDSTKEAIEVINNLKALGVKVAMDDFGTGYSSLSYLTKLPIDLIKVDKTLVDTIGDGEIIRAIVSMGHALSCDIIAEGVEEPEQLEILKNTGCDYIQGFLWGVPEPLEQAVRLLENK